jgi:hypothetical protein
MGGGGRRSQGIVPLSGVEIGLNEGGGLVPPPGVEIMVNGWMLVPPSGVEVERKGGRRQYSNQ